MEHGSSWSGYCNGPAFRGTRAVVVDLGLGKKIYCSGRLDDALNRSGIYRWDETHWTFIGTPDPNPPGFTPPYITSLGVFDDGRGDALYIGGLFRGFAGVTARNLVRYDGQSFEPLGAGVLGEPLFLAGFRDIRGWSMFIDGDMLTHAGGAPLTQSAALWVGCKEGHCYPNCDFSTGSPRLTANDFMCFLNAFARRDPYANCTVDADFNAADFQCFLNKFAAGCSR
ncbi:MAG: hypothetical protein KF678_04375 [Phycisphaeraceae bacterium]|nr:hypothetical protein [Phycisphaeraceae bacterium]